MKIHGIAYLVIGIVMVLFVYIINKTTGKTNLNIFYFVALIFALIGIIKLIPLLWQKRKEKKEQPKHVQHPKSNHTQTQHRAQHQHTHNQHPNTQHTHHQTQQQTSPAQQTQRQQVQIIHCSKCGTRHYATANFCYRCGTRLK